MVGPPAIASLPPVAPPAAPGAYLRGAVLTATRTGATQALVTGWTRDADEENATLTVETLVDGAYAGLGLANLASDAYGPHAFSVVAGVDERARTVCVRALSVGGGSDAQLGCLPIAAFGDLDANGRVGCSDLAILEAYKGKPGTYADGDLDGDGKVSSKDENLLLNRFTSGPGKLAECSMCRSLSRRSTSPRRRTTNGRPPDDRQGRRGDRQSRPRHRRRGAPSRSGFQRALSRAPGGRNHAGRARVVVLEYWPARTVLVSPMSP